MKVEEEMHRGGLLTKHEALALELAHRPDVGRALAIALALDKAQRDERDEIRKALTGASSKGHLQEGIYHVLDILDVRDGVAREGQEG